MELKKPLSEVSSFPNTKSPDKVIAIKTVSSTQEFTDRSLGKNPETSKVPKEMGFV